MTAACRPLVVTRHRQAGVWSTLAVVAVSGLIGRLITGPGFGYAIFAVLWGPIVAAVWAAEEPRLSRTLWISATIGVLLTWPWWGTEPWAAAARMTGLQILMSVSLGIATHIFRPLRLNFAVVRTVAVIAWLTWTSLPLLRPDTLNDTMIEAVLRVNPVLLLNATSATAGDWTHQAVAYHWLTRLGQDVAFDWPDSLRPAVLFYGIPLLTCIAFIVLQQFFEENVPRGTLMSTDGDMP